MLGKLPPPRLRQLVPLAVPLPLRQLAHHAELRHRLKLKRQTPNGHKPLNKKPLHAPPHDVFQQRRLLVVRAQQREPPKLGPPLPRL